MLFVNESTVDAGAGVSLDLSAVEEATCTDFMEGTLEALAENEANWNALLEAGGINELNYYLQTGNEMPYNEAAGQGFFESAKQWFKKAWEKIQSLFKRFFAMFGKMIMNDKDFANKYEKDLIVKTDLKDFKYKGFKFKIDAINVDKASDAIGDADKTFDKDYEYQTWFEQQMGKVIDGKGELTRKEFAKELFRKLRNGEDKKEELDEADVKPATLIAYLKSSEKDKNLAQRNYTSLKRTIDGAIRTTTTTQRNAVKDAVSATKDDDRDKSISESDVATKQIAQLKGKLEILQLVNGACLNAYKSKSAQTKSICVKLLGYKPKNNSADLTGYGENTTYATPTFI